MLVEEDGHDAAAVLEDFCYFVKQPAFGVLRACRLAVGVVAVLGDEQDAIDGELVAAERERFGDRFGEAEFVFRGQFAAFVVIGRLIDIQRRQFETGPLAAAVERVRLQHAGGDDVGMGVVVPDGGDDGDAGFSASSARWPRCESAGA